MELRLIDPPNPRLLSSSSSSSPSSSLLTLWRRRGRSLLLLVRARKRRSPRSNGLGGEPKRELSHILRTEAAVLGVEKRAGSASSTRLWPRAVLEALESSISDNRWESALEIFGLLRKQRWYQPKSRTYARLLTMLGKCRQPEHATSLFRAMLSEGVKPTLDVYTSLVGAYGFSGLLEEAFLTVDEMKTISDCKPDEFTFSILINCCCKLRRFDYIPTLLTEMSYLGLECNVVTYNIMIDGYGKAGMLEDMENSLFDMLENGRCLPDIFTMNSILWAYGNYGTTAEMEKWYNEFQLMGIEPDIQTFNIMIKSYGKAGMHEKLRLVLQYMKKRFFSPTVITFNIIIECFGRAGNIKEMEYYFRLMKIQGVKPNSITYCSLVSGYSKAGLLDRVPAIIRQTENTDVVLDTAFFNCVINAYGQAGEVKIMGEMFELMKEKKCKPDDVTFATMVHAYNAQGMYEAVKLLGEKICRTEKEALVKIF
ncbi:pentatricopeptide repeat-containing protein At3g53170 [Ananas comosus]|uniref:Pentatricopeptide repeat-containing protein n=1 Tax=Ananas comosus TaxID=4615 RepID=A0A199UIB4_ANACO|nr:pentatricopeptide repeat-containing protein At3g53170 [Ananas comosus]XP_020085222.1 pentatricopeptide repeat-containing protein At3g53170 [Ananas comosus]XP_020085223.1 pentatricopeptide repeat-containing protein At3g53170 [Ananas comosus]OAY64478.1 Pentatricopeptide repeat-containing protein [Ananas comosus]